MERGGRRGGGGGGRQYPRREFHARSARNPSDESANNFMFKPVTFSTWRNLMKRQEDLRKEKATALQNIDGRILEVEKSRSFRYKAVINGEQESIREKAKEKESLYFKAERLEVKERENIGDAISPDQANSDILQHELDKKNLKLEKDRILDSYIDLETKFSNKEKQINKEIAEEKENLGIERGLLIDKFLAKERTLELEIQRFCQEIEHQTGELERRSRFDPVLTRNKILEREIIQRDQTVQHLTQYIDELEDRNRMHIDQMRQMTSEFNFEKNRMLQQHENEKASLISQAKCDGVTEFMNGEWHGFAGSHGSGHTDLNQNYASHFSNVNEMSPCYQPMRQSNGAILTDLRDRYEDIKIKALFENDETKYRDTLDMIRNIVSYYESLGMRVYEESTSNKFISTLIWCPNDQLYPNKVEGFFAIGNGDNEEEATENAVQWAHTYIENLSISDESNSNSDGTTSVGETEIGDLFPQSTVTIERHENFSLENLESEPVRLLASPQTDPLYLSPKRALLPPTLSVSSITRNEIEDPTDESYGIIGTYSIIDTDRIYHFVNSESESSQSVEF